MGLRTRPELLCYCVANSSLVDIILLSIDLFEFLGHHNIMLHLMGGGGGDWRCNG
jgi:hypothetical protein